MLTSRRSLILAVVTGIVVVTVIAGTIGGLVGFMVARVNNSTPAQVVYREPDGGSVPQPPVTGGLPQTQPGPAAPPVVPPTQTGPALNSEDAIVTAVAKVKPAVVSISTGRSSGSGVIIDQNGFILTNNHVVEGARTFQVRFDNGATTTARLVGTYPQTDLAVIKVEGAVPAVASLGDSTRLKVGERVIAIGSALGRYTNSVTTGIVSGTNRALGGISGLIQTDAPINQGNSGGPLVNLAGEVVGINSMVVRGGGGDVAEGLGFSIPSAIAKTVAQQLIAGKAVEWPYMGVSLEGAAGGMRVASVEPGSGAARAGLRVGDLLISVEGRAVNPDTALSALLLNFGVGQSVKVDIQRDGQPLTLTITLGKRPANS